MLLKEMDMESSQEVRELLEYDDDLVGSIMTTDFLSFSATTTVAEVLVELRSKKPESAELYNMFVIETNEELIGSFNLRDLVVSEPFMSVSNIMKSEPVHLLDDQKVGAIAELVSKYNLLAVPVVDQNNLLQGMVVIDDVIEDLTRKRRTNKR
jgi:Mg/Co/Ni transporter MgtE